MNAGRMVPNPILAWREIAGEVVIISPEDSVVHELNATASFLWKQMQCGRSVAELAEILAEEFDVDPKTARADTTALFASLEEKRLVVPVLAEGEGCG